MTELVTRRYTFKLYPSRAQEVALWEQSRMMAQLWNALLQRREDVYRRERKTVGNYDQKKEITQLRAECPEWRAISVAAARGVADHLDEAFKAFFKRAKRGDGAQSGYPRYKRVADGMSISFSEKMGAGWSLNSAREIAEKSAMGRFTARRNGKSHSNLNGIASAKASAPSDSGVTETCLTFPNGCHKASAPSDSGVTETMHPAMAAAPLASAPSDSGVTETEHDAGLLPVEASAPSNWRLYVKGVPGLIKTRGTFPAEIFEYRTGEIIRRDGAWWLSIVVKMKPRRSAGTERLKITFDLIDEFARVERAEGQSLACSQEQITGQTQQFDTGAGSATTDLSGDKNRASGRYGESKGSATTDLSGDKNQVIRQGAVRVGSATTDLSGDKNQVIRQGAVRVGSATTDLSGDKNRSAFVAFGNEGSATADLSKRVDAIKSNRDTRYKRWSWRWRRETKRAGRLTTLATRRRKHLLHAWSTKIVATACDLTIFAPAIRKHTASPRGNVSEWGAAVETVSELNRSTLNQAPALAMQLIAYKAAEAGIRCDVIQDATPKIAVGRDLVATGKIQRRAKRALKKAA